MLKTYQKSQVNRLAKPKRNSVDRMMMSVEDLFDVSRSTNVMMDVDSPRSSYLRKTMQGASFHMRKSPSLDGREDVARMNALGGQGQMPDIKKYKASSLTAN